MAYSNNPLDTFERSLPEKVKRRFLSLIPDWEKKIITDIELLQADVLNDMWVEAGGHFNSSENKIVFRSDNITEDTFLHEWGHAFDYKIGYVKYGIKISDTKRWEYLFKKYGNYLLSRKDFSSYYHSWHQEEAFAEAYCLLRKRQLEIQEIKDFFAEIKNKELIELAEKLKDIANKSKTKRTRKPKEPQGFLEQFSREWVSKRPKESFFQKVKEYIMHFFS